MRCKICKKTGEETTLYPGVHMSEMINICEDCAEDQKIPIIKKPTYSQLTQADKTYSVRERLDRMSGRRDSTEISSDQLTTQRNLARLKMPKTKQNHPEILDNFKYNSRYRKGCHPKRFPRNIPKTRSSIWNQITKGQTTTNKLPEKKSRTSKGDYIRGGIKNIRQKTK